MNITLSKEKVNWGIGKSSKILEKIHEKHINIAIYERDVNHLADEINKILYNDLNFKATGNIDSIIKELNKIPNVDDYKLIIDDIIFLLNQFKEISEVKSFKLLLAIVDNDMCRRFHTDLNYIRMLCTYIGPGTLWLSENNLNRAALDDLESNNSIVVNNDLINQVSTGSVAILKGGLYPRKGTKAIVHRSPNIQESQQKRLLLRIDADELFNF
tara:strand:- start:462 stop:1103 length:642 start_codon:yes stop_codon:yes gene_type:complete